MFYATIRNIERGTILEPRYFTVAKLAIALGATPQQVYAAIRNTPRVAPGAPVPPDEAEGTAERGTV